jgi:hypothetical protein
MKLDYYDEKISRDELKEIINKKRNKWFILLILWLWNVLRN